MIIIEKKKNIVIISFHVLFSSALYISLQDFATDCFIIRKKVFRVNTISLPRANVMPF